MDLLHTHTVYTTIHKHHISYNIIFPLALMVKKTTQYLKICNKMYVQSLSSSNAIDKSNQLFNQTEMLKYTAQSIYLSIYIYCI